MNLNNKDLLKWVIIGLLIVVAIVLVLGLGILIGEKKAKFSYRWAEQYHEMFAGPRAGFFGDWRNFPSGEFIEAHGVFGEIIEMKENELVIKGREDVEKVILITDETIIQKGREKMKKEDLKVGNFVVVIGSPDEEGKIEAKMIRLFDGELEGPPMPFKPQRFPFL
jgi:hypothetical protein